MQEKFPGPFRIADDFEEREIIVEDLKKLLKLANVKQAMALIAEMSADWETLGLGKSAGEVGFADPKFLGAWREHRKIYGYTLRAELVYRLKEAFEQGQLDDYVAPKHVLVDEYQDFNPCDQAVAKLLVLQGAELYVAGDDDQSIYGFRHAEPEGLGRFTDDYSPATELELTERKRSGTRILQFSEFVVNQDPRRKPKTLVASSDAAVGTVRILRFRDQHDEASGVASLCQKLATSYAVPLERMLILVRSDFRGKFSTSMRQALLDAGIKMAEVVNPQAPLEMESGREVLCLLRLKVDRKDPLSWRTLLGIRKNNIGSTTLEAIYDLARTTSSSFSDALFKIESDPSAISNRGEVVRKDVVDILTLLTSLAANPQEDPLGVINEVVVKVVSDAEHRESIIQVFETIIDQSGVQDLEAMLRVYSTALGDKEQDLSEGAVPMMTMHQAKGLTADAVFIIAAEDEYIPGRDRESALGDARRLLYVSLTRARQYLFVSHCLRRTGEQQYSGSRPQSPVRQLSQFLNASPVRSIPAWQFIDSF